MMRSELPNETPIATEFANVELGTGGGLVKSPTFETKSTGTFVAPVDTQSQSDKDFNSRQAAFDLANPAGTKISEIKAPTPEQTATAIENTTFNPTTPTNVSETVVKPSKTQENGVKTTVSETGKNWDSSVGREAEINSNLASITATNSQLLTDRSAYDKAFGYATADAGKKALLDSFFSNSGKVSKVGNDLNKYSSYSVNDFAGALTNGWITPSELSSLRSNPATSAKLAKAEELNRINKKTVDVAKAGTEATKEVLNSSPSIAKAMSDGTLSPEELSALTETPEIKKHKAELADKKKEVDELTNSYESIETEVKKELGGKGVTSSFLNQVIANRQRELLPRLKLASSRYDSLYSAYSEEKKTALALFEKNFSFYQDEKKAQSELEKEKRKNIYDSITAQIKFAMENGVDLKRTDVNVVIADAEKYAKDYGVSFEEALKKSFTEPLTAKPSYKTAIENLQAKTGGTKYTMGFDPITGRPYVLDTKTGVVSGAGNVPVGTTGENGGKISGSPMRTDRNNNPTAFTTDIARQAGLVEGKDYVVGDKFPNSNLHTAKLLGDPIEITKRVIDKIGFTTSSGNTRWTYTDSLGLNNSTWSKMSGDEKTEAIKKMYGMEGGNGSLFATFTPSEKSAFSSFDEMKSKGDVNYKDKYSLAISSGYGSVEEFDNAYNAYKSTENKSEGLNENGFNPNITDVYARINSGKTIPKDEVAGLGKSYEQLKTEATAYGNFKKLEAVPSVDSLISSLKEIRDIPKWKRVTARIPGAGVVSSEGAKFNSIYDQIISQSSLNNLIDLKSQGATFGALSDNEMKYIKSASPAGQLAWDLNNEDWKKKIDSLISSSEKIKKDITSPTVKKNMPSSSRLEELRKRIGK